MFKEITDMEQVDLLQQAGLLYHRVPAPGAGFWALSGIPGSPGWVLWSECISKYDPQLKIQFAVYVEEERDET